MLGILLLAAGVAMGEAGQAPANAPIHLTPGAAPPSQELVDTLAARDQALFEAVFGCKLDVLKDMVADDLEFLHDKHGLTSRTGAKFMEDATAGCERQKQGSDFTARRELLPGSMSVYVLNNFGAMQMGTHRFFAVRKGEPDRLTETGKFIDIWRNEGGVWRLARVISYDHVLAAEPAH